MYQSCFDTQNIAPVTKKMLKNYRCIRGRGILLKDVDGIANIADPDQTVP